MTAEEAFLAMSAGGNRELLRWTDLEQRLHIGIYAQEPMAELEAAQKILGLDDNLPAHVSERPLTVLENAIIEGDHENIPREILRGKRDELRQVVLRALEWGQFSQEGEKRLRDWVESI
jgi:hypothetical protein